LTLQVHESLEHLPLFHPRQSVREASASAFPSPNLKSEIVNRKSLTIPLSPPHPNRVSNALFYEGKLFEPRFEYLFYERKPFEPPFPSRTPRGKGKSAFPSSISRGDIKSPSAMSGTRVADNLKSEMKNRKSKIVIS
jgi:hypothetical protein